MPLASEEVAVDPLDHAVEIGFGKVMLLEAWDHHDAFVDERYGIFEPFDELGRDLQMTIVALGGMCQ